MIQNTSSDCYLIKCFTTAGVITQRYFDVDASSPRDAVAHLELLVPGVVVVDVYAPPLPPEEWVTT